jgi:hypothetical protein
VAKNPSISSSIFSIRGGSTATATTVAPAASKPKSQQEDLKAYLLQQQLCLQSRSHRLRQALILRGLDAFQVGETDASHKPPKVVDWDCTCSTKDEPRGCLYSHDEAEENVKVLAPRGDMKNSITLKSLNRLRRNDPSKVDPMWHMQFAIMKTWFRPNTKFSLYHFLPMRGTLLAVMLDSPLLLVAAMMTTIVFGVLLTSPLWETLVSFALTSNVLWLQWPNWGRFLHAPLPLKLLLGQMAWKVLVTAFYNIYSYIRLELVEWECNIMERCIPMTIIPKSMMTKEEEEKTEGVDGNAGEMYEEAGGAYDTYDSSDEA